MTTRYGIFDAYDFVEIKVEIKKDGISRLFLMQIFNFLLSDISSEVLCLKVTGRDGFVE